MDPTNPDSPNFDEALMKRSPGRYTHRPGPDEIAANYAAIRRRLKGPLPAPVEPIPAKPQAPIEFELPPPLPPSASNDPVKFITALLAELEPLAARKIADVIRATARLSGLTATQLIESDRTWERVRPRQIAMTICILGLRREVNVVGYRFGGRDHTTVLHAVGRWRETIGPMLDEHRRELEG